jgi:hypothetical protein
MVCSGTCPDTDEEREVASAAWTSSWMHVETGMALAAGVPVLVAPEAKVCEGVFAPGTWTRALRGTSADTPDLVVVNEWAAAVAKRSGADIVDAGMMSDRRSQLVSVRKRVASRTRALQRPLTTPGDDLAMIVSLLPDQQTADSFRGRATRDITTTATRAGSTTGKCSSSRRGPTPAMWAMPSPRWPAPLERLAAGDTPGRVGWGQMPSQVVESRVLDLIGREMA